MKHDDFYDEIYDLAQEYMKTPWWKPWRAHFLKKEINRRWNQFIKELSSEQVNENLLVAEDIQSRPLPDGKLSSLPQMVVPSS